MARFLWICLGGAAGTGARYLLSSWIARQAGPGFPWGTFAVNVIGSFLLGAIVQAALTAGSMPLTLRLALTTGVMGGFTTYSAFNQETLVFLRDGAWTLALLYVGATSAACLMAGLLGLACGRLLAG